ncbi:MAG: S-layer protein domain-containing protein [Methanothrix sp.]
MAEFKDYYQILGAKRNDNHEKIRHNYRLKVSIHNSNYMQTAPESVKRMAEEEWKELNEAYEILGDPAKRDQYNFQYDLNKKETEQYKKYIDDLTKESQLKNRVFKVLVAALAIVVAFAIVNWMENDALKNTLSSKIAEIGQYRESLNSMNREVARLEDNLGSMTYEITNLKGLLKSRDSDIKRLKEEIESRTDEIRGTTASGNFEWNPQNFAGFYFDIDDNTGNEILTTNITDGKLSDTDGIIYSSQIQKKKFQFKDWGSFNVIGFLGEKHFAGYINDDIVDDAKEILLKESVDKDSLYHKQLEAVLKDDDNEMTVTSGTPLMLREGYELAIKSIDIENNKVYLDLSKDDSVVDSKVIYPTKDNATMADKTYYFRKTLGNQKDLVIIAVHFKNAFRGTDQNLATVDGIWQISDTATNVKADAEHDKMRIRTIDASKGTIIMDNKDNTITLSKNKHIALMGDINIRTANDNDFRYYICKDE